MISVKEFFRTCNVLPFSCSTHLPLCRGKVKDPRYMLNKKDPRISLVLTTVWVGGTRDLESLGQQDSVIIFIYFNLKINKFVHLLTECY